MAKTRTDSERDRWLDNTETLSWRAGVSGLPRWSWIAANRADIDRHIDSKKDASK